MMELFLIGRIIFGAYFLMNAFNHFSKHKDMVGYALSKKVPMASVAVPATGTLLLLGSLGVIFGMYLELAGVLLLIFLVPVTFMMHAFWKIQDPMQKMGEMVNFTKNIALIGAVLMLIAM
jgi:putative oxidoreductase